MANPLPLLRSRVLSTWRGQTRVLSITLMWVTLLLAIDSGAALEAARQTYYGMRVDAGLSTRYALALGEELEQLNTAAAGILLVTPLADLPGKQSVLHDFVRRIGEHRKALRAALYEIHSNATHPGEAEAVDLIDQSVGGLMSNLDVGVYESQQGRPEELDHYLQAYRVIQDNMEPPLRKLEQISVSGLESESLLRTARVHQSLGAAQISAILYGCLLLTLSWMLAFRTRRVLNPGLLIGLALLAFVGFSLADFNHVMAEVRDTSTSSFHVLKAIGQLKHNAHEAHAAIARWLLDPSHQNQWNDDWEEANRNVEVFFTSLTEEDLTPTTAAAVKALQLAWRDVQTNEEKLRDAWHKESATAARILYLGPGRQSYLSFESKISDLETESQQHFDTHGLAAEADANRLKMLIPALVLASTAAALLGLRLRWKEL